MDRIDLHIEVPVVDVKELADDNNAKQFLEPSSKIRERVINARLLQNKRFANSNIFINAEMRNEHIKKYCQLSKESKQILVSAANNFNLSARSYFKIIKVARTIADLENSLDIETNHIAEAIQYRFKES